jgi:hypothetical protein
MNKIELVNLIKKEIDECIETEKEECYTHICTPRILDILADYVSDEKVTKQLQRYSDYLEENCS